MSDEEKEAIKYFKKEIMMLKETIVGFEEEIEDKQWLKKQVCELNRDLLMRETLINLIDKLQKENQELKEDNSHQWEERCRLTFELEKLKEENQKLKECHFKYEEMTGIDLLLGE